MAIFLDARVPVMIEALAGADDAVLAETGRPLLPGQTAAAWFTPSRKHSPGCACCVLRSPAAMAMAGLFAARARGTVPFFRRLVLLPWSSLGAAELRAALEDPLVSGRFRLMENPAQAAQAQSAGMS